MEQMTNTREVITNRAHESVGWGFWARWSLASLLGLTAGMVGFVAVGIFAGDFIDQAPEFVFGVVLGITFGGGIGIAQWRVLRRRLGPVAAWIGATVAGFVVGAAIIFGLMNGSEPDTTLQTKLGHSLVLGASLGIAQWSALRTKLHDARPWVAISVISWVVAELVGVALTALAGPPFDLLGLFLLGAVLPGAGMAWLLSRGTDKPNRTNYGLSSEMNARLEKVTEKTTRNLALALLGEVLLAAVLLAAPLVAGFLMTGSARADGEPIFTVNSTRDAADLNTGDFLSCDASPADGSQCTLRAAIQEANATPGRDIIHFDIPGSGAFRTISPDTPMPPIREQVTILGYTQPGSSRNTATAGTNAVLKVELNGSDVADGGSFAPGLEIEASGVRVEGLVINRFGGEGIRIDGGSGNEIAGNFVGTDPTGTQDLGNGADGIRINGASGATNTLVGGLSTAARNLVSGNDADGVEISGASASNSLVGNLIGTRRNGTAALGNASEGVLIAGAANNFVGAGGSGNTIAFNGDAGVGIQEVGLGSNANGNRIFANSIFSNSELGIDLGGSGPDANDADDADVGPNGRQNKPVLASAVTSSTATTIKGKLNSSPNTSFTVQFFSNPSGNEGQKFIGEATVSTDGSGNASFTFKPAQRIALGQTVTATATKNFTRDTSELSAQRKVVAP